MYKVLIVDDERVVRVSLRTLIDWNAVGCEVIDAATDGEAALAVVCERCPDIIITDLKMPRMDGLSFIKAINDAGYSGKIIVMSGYGDFELVREALRNRVFDYILKATVKPDELRQVVERAVGELRAEGRSDGNPDGESSRGADVELFSHFFSHMKKTPREDAETGSVLSDNASFSAPYSLVYVFAEDALMENPRSQARSLSMLPILEELTGHHFMFLSAVSDFAAVLILESGQADDFARDKALVKRIYSTVHMYMNCDCGFVISGEFSSAEELSAELSRCAEASSLALYTGYGVPILCSDARSFARAVSFNARRVDEDARALISNGNFDEAVGIFTDALEYLRSAGNPPVLTRQFAVAFLENLFIEYSLYFDKDGDLFRKFTSGYAYATTAVQYVELFRLLMENVRENLFVGRKTAYRREVQNIIDFIKDNVDKRITLTMIAEHANMAESYVSRLFRNETGTTIVHFINTVKMEAAKELLRRDGILVKQVSVELGFDEQSYFNRMFSKYCGMTPSEYKKRYGS